MFDFHWPYLIAWVASVAIIIWRYEVKLRHISGKNIQLKQHTYFLEEELSSCRNKIVRDFGALNNKSEDQSLVTQKKELEFLSTNTTTKDDLKIVEGIGPKIEMLLHESSIFTFEDLSKTSVISIKKILEKAGSRYSIHNPTTWPKQAELAHEGKWDELKKWQSELDKGRIV